MRHASMRRRRLLPLLAASALLAACQAAPATAPGGLPYAYSIGRGSARVALTPRFVQAPAPAARRRLQAQIATRSVADIVHMVVVFNKVDFDGAGNETGETLQGSIDLQAGELFNTIVVGDLANDATYRFRATAYASAGTGAPISDDAGSWVDLVTTNDDRPVAGELKVRLADVPFDGRATSQGLAVQAGGYSHPVATGVLVTSSRGVVTVAGDVTAGFADSDEDGGQLEVPRGLGTDADGHVYVADAGNHAIRRLDPDGVLTTIAGDDVAGDGDGALAEARFSNPTDVAAAPDGKLYVADTDNGSIRLIDDANDDVSTPISGLNGPRGVAIAANGHLWVADSGNNRVVEYDAAGVELRRFGSPAGESGFVDGDADGARFDRPWGLACAPDGTVYVADRQNHSIRRISPDGDVDTYAGDGDAGSGNGDGEGVPAQYALPGDLSLDTDGTLYIADSGNHRIRKIDPDGYAHDFAGFQPTIEAGWSDHWMLDAAKFDNPLGVVVDRVGQVFVGDAGNHRLRRIQSKGRTPS